MIKDLFPLNTFQQDAVLKRLNEISSKAASVEEIEDGELDNAKPIYCHPISVEGTNAEGTYKIKISMIIFDNSNEEYNTLAKLSTKMQTIFTLNVRAIFPITGALFNISTNTLHVAQKIDFDDGIYIRTLRQDGENGYFGFSQFTNTTIYDGVNKIN